MILGVEDYSKATWVQNFLASIAGAVASITVAAPLDVVKTRIQNANFEHKVSGVTVLKELFKNEGPLALFKGLTPKACRSLKLHSMRPEACSAVDSCRWTKTSFQLHTRTIVDTTLRQICMIDMSTISLSNSPPKLLGF